MTDSTDVLIGKIVKPHGVEGAVIIEVLTDYPEERFRSGQSVRIQNEGNERLLTVESGSEHQGRWLVSFDEIHDRDKAEGLRDSDVVIDEEEVIGQEGELYDFDLEGMTVYNQDDREVGRVTAVGGRDRAVLEIETAQNGVLDFPAHHDFIKDYDRHEGWIKLRFPRGWKNLKRSE